MHFDLHRDAALGRSARGAARPAILAITAVLALSALVALLWRSADPTAAGEGGIAADVRGAPAAAMSTPLDGDVAAAGDRTLAIADGGASAQSVAAGSLHGRLVAPRGPWPGGGELELVPYERVDGGFMGMMGELMSAGGARGDRRRDRFVAALGLGDAIATSAVASDGRFRFAAPPAGRYSLRLLHDRLSVPREFVVEAQAAVDVDVGDVPTESSGSLLVLVSDPAGQPIAGARLLLGGRVDPAALQNPESLRDMQSVMRKMMPDRGETDARGAHRFVGLRDLEWRLLVRAEDYVEQLVEVLAAPGRETVLRVALRRGGGLEVVVGGPDGAPYEEARVRVWDPVASEAMQPFAGAVQLRRARGITERTDAGGVARFSGLPPGTVRVGLRTPGFFAADHEVAVVEGRTARLELDLDLGVTVAGRVVDEEGEPVADARVRHVAALGESIMGIDLEGAIGVDVLGGDVERTGLRCAEDGRFEVGGFELDEEVHLVADAPGYVPTRAEPVKAGTTDVELRLRRAAVVRGRVVAGVDGGPVPEFSVALSRRVMLVMDRPVGRQRVSGAENGEFVLEELPRDRLTLRVDAPGFGPQQVVVDTTPGDVDVGTVELELPAAVAGVVLDPDGVPVADAAVRVARGGMLDSVVMAGLTGADLVRTGQRGEFRIDGLRAKRVRLLADADGYGPARSAPVALQAGSVVDGVVLQLAVGGRLRGTIVRGDGQPLASWQVRLTSSDGGSLQQTESDAAGVFRLDGLAAGAHKIEAFPPDLLQRFGAAGLPDPSSREFDIGGLIEKATRWTVRDRVVVRDGEVAEIELVFDEEGFGDSLASVQGTVSVGAEPLDDGVVTWQSLGAAGPPRLVGVRDGRFEVHGVRPGTYRVQAQDGILSAPIGRAVEVVVRDAGTVGVHVDLPAGRIEGRVVSAADGTPVAGVALRWVEAGAGDAVDLDQMLLGEGTALTGDDGRFAFRGLSPGSYDVVAREIGIAGGERRTGRVTGVRLAAGEVVAALEVVLAPGADLHVHVRDARGARGNALLAALDATGQPLALSGRVLTDASGNAVLAGLPPGRYRVLADAPGAAPGLSAPVEISGGIGPRVEIVLASGVEVVVEVDAASAASLGGLSAAYLMRDREGALVRSGQAALPRGGGRVSLGEFASGEYEVRVMTALGEWRHAVNVPPQGPVVLKLEVEQLR